MVWHIHMNPYLVKTKPRDSSLITQFCQAATSFMMVYWWRLTWLRGRAPSSCRCLRGRCAAGTGTRSPAARGTPSRTRTRNPAPGGSPPLKKQRFTFNSSDYYDAIIGFSENKLSSQVKVRSLTRKRARDSPTIAFSHAAINTFLCSSSNK